MRVSLTDGAAGSTTTYDPDHNDAIEAQYRSIASGREHYLIFDATTGTLLGLGSP